MVKCNKCKTVYKKATDIKKHDQELHELEYTVVKLSEKSKERQTNYTFKCKKCNYQNIKKQGINLHITKIHGRDNTTMKKVTINEKIKAIYMGYISNIFT